MNSSKKITFFVSVSVFILLLIVSYLLIVNRAMDKGLDHDEHQFIASAYLFARDWQLPYVDYAYFHMPNLVFIYAVLFKFTSYKLLAARYFSAMSAVLTVSVLFWATYLIFRKQSLSVRLVMALCAAILLLANPLFTYVVGLAWNHDFSTLLALVSTVVFVWGFRKNNVRPWLFVSGLFLSLAIGVRASWAVAIPPFLLAVFLFQKKDILRTKLSSVLWFFMGGFLGMLPSIILFSMAPTQFIFGNLRYAQLNTLYRQEIGYTRSMVLGTKIDYFLDFQNPGFVLFLFLLVFVVFVLSMIRFRKQKKFEPISLFAILLILFIFVGGLMPTPSFRQYFYGIVPFSILAILYQISEINLEQIESPYKGWAVCLIVVAAIISGYYGLGDIPASINPDKNATWFPLHAHWTSEKLASKVDSGKILTLSPIFAVELDRDIYPEFVTGPFAWRTAHFVPENQRSILGVVAPEDLEAFLSKQPPSGILVGNEPGLEAPFLEYAEQYGYSPEKISSKQDIWLP